MDNVTRRRYLAAAATGITGVVAGCAAPQSESSVPGSSSTELEVDGDLAGESAYTQVYDAVIDSIAQVRAYGVESPRRLGEGTGQGSGFLVALEQDGAYLITNEHVVSGADSVEIQYIGGDWTTATIAGTDYYSDLAVLAVDHVPDDAVSLPLSEQTPVVGQQVLAIGAPYGLEGSVSQGIVSGVNRSVDVSYRRFPFPNAIQTDAAVNPGNSGGPLVDLEGRAIGVVNAGGGDNIGFAISAALARRVVPALADDGVYEHSYLGISYREVTRAVVEEYGLEEASGVLVSSVDPNGPADDELERGDVIYELDGEPIPDRHALGTYLALETRPGDEVGIEFWRDGQERTVTVTLGSR
ncbi:S1C family serine protease [Halostagnicola kamekurae]|uniref:Serine protease, S1-C subfamily, contains C-terminal PDZ domain n=1 Tax=Halostagnicola kamekurae TaxID=619731 RepID=A0A1I6S816_9EURY|nr:trypsin-like peptidase domain-containing protein [Halostagnicola kamekurae]SFS73053.1 serine protease, S1-C subfamily, contains C-terminal PDZ domain [Halostagnicola kamekurae]